MTHLRDPDDPRLTRFDVRRDVELRREGRLLCEGPLVVRRLIDGPMTVEAVLVAERKAAAFADAPGEVLVVPDDLLQRAAGFKFHRGVLAIGRGDVRPGLPDQGPVLALAGVEDAENVGSLIRLAAGFGCSGVLLGPGCHDPLYRRVIRVSMGHALTLPLYRTDDLAAALLALPGPSVAAVLADDAVPLSGRPSGLGTLVVGNEAHGVPADVAAACDVRAMIPMAGGVDSLNVAVAAGIFLHHLTTP